MDIFEAIADPVRRSILERLNGKSLSAGEIAAGYAISRPAISRHLRVLREAGLVRAELIGRRQIYGLEPGALGEVDDWLGQFRSRVPALLDALETEVYRTRRERREQASLHHDEEERRA
jgi:DNA-binding transcriptional ArsR family regulator